VTSLRTLPMINVVPTTDLAVVPDLAVVAEITIVARPVPATPASRHVMGLLADGVPLSLLMDLASPAGPPSADIASSEYGPRSVIGDLLAFRAGAAEGTGRAARARTALRTLRLG
jgi:hypothetical protein